MVWFVVLQEMAIDMTGQMSPPQRAEEWRSRRVFYVTPQCLEKDIQSGAATLTSKRLCIWFLLNEQASFLSVC